MALNCTSDQTMREVTKLCIVALREFFGFHKLCRCQFISSSNVRKRRRRQGSCTCATTLPAVWLEFSVELHNGFERSSAVNTRTQIRKQTCETQQPDFEVPHYRSLTPGRPRQRVDASRQHPKQALVGFVRRCKLCNQFAHVRQQLGRLNSGIQVKV